MYVPKSFITSQYWRDNFYFFRAFLSPYFCTLVPILFVGEHFVILFFNRLSESSFFSLSLRSKNTYFFLLLFPFPSSDIWSK